MIATVLSVLVLYYFGMMNYPLLVSDLNENNFAFEYMLQWIFISVNVCFSFGLNLLAYITISKNDEKIKLN